MNNNIVIIALAFLISIIVVIIVRNKKKKRNSIKCRVPMNDDKQITKKLLYYIKYDGEIIASINLKDLDINIDEQKKVITIKDPEINYEYIVNDGSMDIIYADKSSKEQAFKDLFKQMEICKKDMQYRINQEIGVKNCAIEYARQTIKDLIMPWLNQIDNKYKIEFEG